MPPSTPVEANPIVKKQSKNTYEIIVTGLKGKRSLEVERGFHEVADEACQTKAGWSGWKMSDGKHISPVKQPSGVFVATGSIVCSG